MRIIERTPDRLVLRESAALVYVIGGIAIAAGIGVAAAAGERAAGIGSVIFGVVIVLAFANAVTAKFDRGTRRVTILTKGPLRNREASHSLDDVTDARVEARAAGNRPRGYRVTLTQAGGTRIPLTSSYSSSKPRKEQAATAIRELLSLNPPPDVR